MLACNFLPHFYTVQLFVVYLNHQWVSGQLAKFITIFSGIANTTSTTLMQGVGSHEVIGKHFLKSENIQMALTGTIFCSTYHTKQLNPWPSSPASHLVIYSWLPTCPVEIEPDKNDPRTCGHPTNFINMPQQKQPGSFRH